MRCPAVVREKEKNCRLDGKFILIINILLFQAAWGGGLLMSEKYKALRFDGVHRANSLTWNPHKLLGALLQCSTFHINEKVKHYQIRSGPENLQLGSLNMFRKYCSRQIKWNSNGTLSIFPTI